MRKKILSAIAVVAVAAVAGYNVYTAQKNDMKLSDLTLANVEALAQNPSENVDGSYKGYAFDPQDCMASKIVPCYIGLYIPGYGHCSINFSYTVTVQGTQNPCKDVNDPEVSCIPYQCRAN
jgi:hypothetical protein